MPQVHDHANLDTARLDGLNRRVASHTTLEKLIAAGFVVTEVLAADEFSLDALVPLEDGLCLVYHLT